MRVRRARLQVPPGTRQGEPCVPQAGTASGCTHEPVTLPSLAGGRKHGMPSPHMVHDLLVAWQGRIDEGVDLPSLRWGDLK